MLRAHSSYRLTRRVPSLFVLASCGALLLACGARTSLNELDNAASAHPATPADGGDAGSTSSMPLTCVSETVSIDDLRPTVTLLVDQSGSMRFPYPDQDSPQSRWALVRDALLDPARGVLKTFQSSLRFGIVFFTSDNGFSGGVCPILSEVHAATNNYDAISSLFDSLTPDDDTPTGASIDAVVTQIKAAPTHGPQIIVLVTDGDSDTCEVPDPQNGQPDAVAATKRAYAAGIELYVIGISNDISGHNLQELANAGKGQPIDAVYGVDPDAAPAFQASQDVTGLTGQLSEILAQVSLCDVSLDRDVGVAEASAGQVVLDGQPLAYGSMDGYVLADPRHLRVVGKACQTIEAAGKTLSVRISCN